MKDDAEMIAEVPSGEGLKKSPDGEGAVADTIAIAETGIGHVGELAGC